MTEQNSEQIAGKILNALLNNELDPTGPCQFYDKEKELCFILKQVTECVGNGFKCEICPHCD